jgi:hypothetical protein
LSAVSWLIRRENRIEGGEEGHGRGWGSRARAY